MKCPYCNLINPDNAIRCDCGYDFKRGKLLKSYIPEKPIEAKSEFKSDILSRIFLTMFSPIALLSCLVLLISQPISKISYLIIFLVIPAILFILFHFPIYLNFNSYHITFGFVWGIKIKVCLDQILKVYSLDWINEKRIIFDTRFWDFNFHVQKGEDYESFTHNIKKVLPDFSEDEKRW